MVKYIIINYYPTAGHGSLVRMLKIQVNDTSIADSSNIFEKFTENDKVYLLETCFKN